MEAGRWMFVFTMNWGVLFQINCFVHDECFIDLSMLNTFDLI